MALLNSSQPSSVYVDPRASVLYGAGNNNITPAQIKDYITAPGRSEQDILGAALANNVSINQIQNAMAGTNMPLNAANMSDYAKSQGISFDKKESPITESANQGISFDKEESPITKYSNIDYKPVEYMPTSNIQDALPVTINNMQNYTGNKSVTQVPYTNIEYQPIQYNPISNVEAVQDPIKGTVAGQLNNILDPNSPLMQRAATYGNQQSNARGLLNSSIGISAAYAPMIDAGIQIATPDAASNNQFALFNADSANRTNQFNADISNRTSQFNASNALSASVANAGNLKDIGINTSNLQNQLDIANLDANTKLNLANLDSKIKYNLANLDKNTRFGLANIDANTQLNLGNLDKSTRLTMANLDRNTQFAIANLDTNTKLKIANINALSNDSQLASSMNQSLMNAIVEINKQDKPVDVRQAEIQQLVNLTSKSIGLLNSFDTNIPTLDFSDITGVNLAGNKQADVTGGGTNQPSGSGSTVVSNLSLLNPLGYTVEPDTQKKVLNFQSATGYTVDPAKVVPQRLVDDLQSIADPTQNITNTYQNLKAYDWKKMMADTGSQSATELVSKLFTPVYMPSPMNIPGKPTLAFYMYK